VCSTSDGTTKASWRETQLLLLLLAAAAAAAVTEAAKRRPGASRAVGDGLLL